MAFTKVVGPGIHTQSQLRTHNIHSSGIITASSFVGPLTASSGSSGTFDSLTVTGNVSVGGTLQYEDVTNVDSVGVITARAGINISGGFVGINTTDPEEFLDVVHTKVDQTPGSDDIAVFRKTGSGYLKVFSNTSGMGGIAFGDTDDTFIGALQYNHSDNSMRAYVNNDERLRITSAGLVGIGTTVPDHNLHVYQNAGDAVLTIESQGNGNDAALEFIRTSSGGDSKGGASIYVTGDTSASEAKMHFGVGHNIAHGQVPRMTIMGNGEVGIGTDDPTRNLHVFGDGDTKSIVAAVAGDALFDLSNTGNGNWSGINFTRERSTGSVTGGSIWMPSVTANNSALLYLQTQTASAQAGVDSALVDNNGVRVKLASQPGGQGADTAFSVEIGASERFRINNEGKVKIAVPTSKIGITTGNLDVWGDATSYPTLRLGSLEHNEEGEHIRFGRSDISSDIRYHSLWGRHSSTTASNYLAFKLHNGSGSPFTAQTEVLRLAGDGTVGIGSLVPTGKLDIAPGGNSFIKFGQDADNPKMEMFRSTGGSPSHYGAELQLLTGDFIFSNAPGANLGSHSYTERLRIKSDGRVGINTALGGASDNAILSIHSPASSACRFNLTNTGSSSAESTQIWSQNNDLVFEAGADERLRILASGQSTFDRGAPASADKVIARFQCESSRKLDIVWHDTGSKMGFNTPGNHDYTFKCNDVERLTIDASSAHIQVHGTFQVNNFQIRDAGFSGTWNTGISVNAGNAGACMIFLCCRNWDALDNTHAGVYIVRLGYSGGQNPGVTHISGNNSWTIDRNTTDDTVQINGGSGNQRVCILWTT